MRRFGRSASIATTVLLKRWIFSVQIMKACAAVLFAVLALAGCQAVITAAGRPSADITHWTTYRVEVGAQIVQFSIPPGESREFSAFTIPTRIDLGRADLFDETLAGPALLSRMWDYRESGFVVVDGSLSAGITVNRSDRPLGSLDALKAAVEDANKLYVMKTGGQGQSTFAA